MKIKIGQPEEFVDKPLKFEFLKAMLPVSSKISL
jgi:hypothetical protein